MTLLSVGHCSNVGGRPKHLCLPTTEHLLLDLGGGRPTVVARLSVLPTSPPEFRCVYLVHKRQASNRGVFLLAGCGTFVRQSRKAVDSQVERVGRLTGSPTGKEQTQRQEADTQARKSRQGRAERAS